MAKNGGHTSVPERQMYWSCPLAALAGLLRSSTRISTKHRPGTMFLHSRRTATLCTLRKDSVGIRERRLLSAMHGQRRRLNRMYRSLVGPGKVHIGRNSFWMTSGRSGHQGGRSPSGRSCRRK